MASTQSNNALAKNKVTRSTLHPGLHKYPAFYACYLLRSYQNGKPNQRTYVGSTPDPPRRFRQHNGQLKGGAVRTKYYRPWEMELICYGFPSKLVALQFEWAWNTPYKSRHLQIVEQVLKDDLNQAKINFDGSIAEKVNVVTTRKKPMFPRSMGNRVEVKLKVLRKMITSLPWSQYPLKVLFFEEGAYRLWLEQAKPPKSLPKNNQKISKTSMRNDPTISYPHPIDAVFRPEGVDGMRKSRFGLLTSTEDQAIPLAVHDEEAILEDYEKIEAIKKRTNGDLKCYTCEQPIDIEQHLLYVTCLSPDCLMSAHTLCLAKHFLRVPPASGEEIGLSVSLASVDEPVDSLPRVLPDRGSCPACSVDLRWGELIKSCYRRMPKNPSMTQISDSDDAVDLDQGDDNSDLVLDYPPSSELEDLKDPSSNFCQTKKKPPSFIKPTRNQPAKYPRKRKPTQVQALDEEEDGPEQDFVKMMDELQVSD